MGNLKITCVILAAVALAAFESPAETIGPCTTEGMGWNDPPVKSEDNTHDTKGVGTSNCPPFEQASTCNSGVYTGNCLRGHFTAHFVDCRGQCTAEYGNAADKVACLAGSSDEIRRGTAEGDCVIGYCTVFATGETESFAGVMYGPLEGFFEGSDACEPGGDGVSEGYGYGVGISYLTPPVP